MRLTDFTDYSLRSLIYLNRVDRLVTLNELSDAINVSRNHLIKVVNKLSKEGYVETVRGRLGGLRINPDTATVGVGDIVKATEDNLGLASCHRETSPSCPLLAACKLSKSLDKAMNSFLESLNERTLQDIT